eukprot:1138199-Pelagomonas_calceolata.AAC.10
MPHLLCKRMRLKAAVSALGLYAAAVLIHTLTSFKYAACVHLWPRKGPTLTPSIAAALTHTHCIQMCCMRSPVATHGAHLNS